MSFEKMRIRNVHNFYGPRDSGGTQGVNGAYDSYSINFDGERLTELKFPISNHTTMPGVNILVTGVTVANATGTMTSLKIGNVEVKDSTEAAPVKLAKDNTGVVTVAGLTAGTILVKFKKFMG